MSYTQNGLFLRGEQASGAPWSALVPASNVLKCEVWSAVLQKGEAPSLLIYKAPETGLTEGGELTILSFDPGNRPMPWKAYGAFSSTAKGISQVVADETTGNAKVVVPVLEGDPHTATAQVTSLYERRNGSFAKVIGNDGRGNSWPYISGSTKALTGKEQLSTSTLSARTLGTLSASSTESADVVVVRRTAFSDDAPLVLSNNQRAKFPAMLVLDKADGSRTIYTDENVVEGIDQAISQKAAISVDGTSCESDECRPFLIVARGRAVQ